MTERNTSTHYQAEKIKMPVILPFRGILPAFYVGGHLPRLRPYLPLPGGAHRNYGLAILVTLLYLWQPYLIADEYPALPSTIKTPADAIVNEVVIYGTRTSQTLSHWPASAYSVKENELKVSRHRHIAETLVRMPGVWISRGNGQEHLTALRSPVLTGAGACGAFLMAEDNIPLGAAGFCNVNQLLESTSELAARVEVLAGPQSVLYGTNALHGVINIVSPLPQADRSTQLAVEGGGQDYYRTRLSTAGERWYAGFDGVQSGGYNDHAGFDQQKLKVRHRTHIDQWIITSTAALTNLNQETSGFIDGHDAYKNQHLKKLNPNPEAYRNVRAMRLQSRFEYSGDGISQWQITPYVRDTEMEFLMHFLPWQPIEKNSHRSIGWQSSLRHQLNPWLDVHTGLDGEYTRGQLEEIQRDGFSPTTPAGIHYDYSVDAEVISPFSILRWQVNEASQLSLGLRYEWLRYDYDNKAAGNSACAPGVLNCRFSRPDDTSDSFNNASWQLGALYEFMPGHSVFANFARGYRAPQTTELYRLQAGQQQTELDAETLDNIELGLRGETPVLQYTLSAYRMDKEDVIFQDANRQNISGAKTLHRGIELAISWQPRTDWYLDLNGSYAKHSYASAMPIGGANIKGNDIDTAPRFTGSARAGKHFAKQSSAELEWVYMGSYFTDPENQHSYPGHHLLNLRINWQLARRWQVGLRINNLANVDYAERADFGFGQDRYFVGEPRAGFVEISRQL